MVKVARAPGGRKGGTPQQQKGGKGGNTPRQQQQSPGGNKLKTKKGGSFSFTMVADGCYIEHEVRIFTCTRESPF